MNSNEIYQKYLEAEKERCDLENKIENYVEEWKNGKTVLSNVLIQQAMEKGNERLDGLKKMKNNCIMSISNKNKEKERKKVPILVFNII